MRTEILKNNKKKNRFLSIMKRIFTGIAAVILLVLFIGFVYEKTASYSDQKKYKPVGKVVDVNGHNMHIFAKGQGKATVVFVSGWGIPCPYADFYPLYNEISKYTRIAVYDRPGYGWSDTANTPRDIDTITEELHELLHKSGEKGPYILVAHSLGSLEVIRFAQRYKDEVKGIVMIEGGNPDYYSKEDMTDCAGTNSTIISVLKQFGILRLMFNSSGFCDSVYSARNKFSLEPKELKVLDESMYLKNVVNKNKSDEQKNIKTNAAKVVSKGKLSNIPLRILTSESEAAADTKWEKSQEAFKSWSSDSKQIVVSNANHNIHQYAPEVVNREILDILDNIK